MNKCLIRRTSALLSKYLPLKYELVVCIRMGKLQTDLYNSFIQSDSVRKSMEGLLFINSLLFKILEISIFN